MTWWSRRSRTTNIARCDDAQLAGLVSDGGTLADLKGMWRERALPATVNRWIAVIPVEEGPVMRHQNASPSRSRQALVTRQRFAFAGAIVVGALLPFALRLTAFPDPRFFHTSQVSLIANLAAIIIASWIRLSVGTFPGTRSGTLIAPSIAAAHGIVLALLLMTRLPYDRLAA